MQNLSAFEPQDLVAASAEWKTERLHSWKEIASFFRREVRTVQLWEKSEGLPVRRQQHRKLGSVYAYRHELEGWWIARSALSAEAKPRQRSSDGAAGKDWARPDAGRPHYQSAELDRILVFPIEVIHSQRDRGLLQETVHRLAGGLKDDITLELTRSRFDPICLAAGALPSPGTSTPGFMRDVAQEFRSECYLAGSIRYAGRLVLVSVQLVRSADAVCLWADRFETTLDDGFDAQAELARRIVQALPAQRVGRGLSLSEPSAAEHGPAYHACKMGFHFWKQRTRGDLMKAVGYFEDAILIDPLCADAYAGLADTYVSLSYHHFMPARDAMEAAQRAVTMALMLDPKSTNVRNAEINFNKNCTWDWKAAERACQEMVNAASVEPRTLQLYADLMINCGRPEDSISLALYAHRLEPHSESANSQVSFAYFYAGDYDNAISFIRRTIALRPLFNTGHALLGRAEAMRGNWEKAIESFERGLTFSSDSLSLKALLAYGYAGMGDLPMAGRILCDIEQHREDACFPAVDVSAVHAMLNQETEALKHISRAYELRDMKMAYIQYDPRFTGLRALPQFRQIASSVQVCSS